MIRRRSAFGLCVLAIFVAGAVAAQSADAVPNGTTMFLCKKTGKGDFTAAHCAPGDKGAGEYSHVTIPENTWTQFGAANLDTKTNHIPWKFQATVGGVALELQSDEVILYGSARNFKDTTTGEHTLYGLIKMDFKSVTVTKPAKETCKVYKDELPEPGAEEEFQTRNLWISTLKQGDGMKFEPEAGAVLASFYLKKCTNAALNKTYDLTGSFKTLSLNGATASFSLLDTTAQKTLKLSGSEAGLEGVLTFEVEPPEEPPTPVSFTTMQK